MGQTLTRRRGAWCGCAWCAAYAALHDLDLPCSLAHFQKAVQLGCHAQPLCSPFDMPPFDMREVLPLSLPNMRESEKESAKQGEEQGEKQGENASEREEAAAKCMQERAALVRCSNALLDGAA